MSKKDLHIPVSQDLIKDLLPLLGRDEDITGIVDQLLKSELESRLGLSHTNDITYDVDADRAFPSLTEELPVKHQYLDLKHIDRDVVKEKKCDQNGFYNPESDEEIHLVHIEPKLRSVEPLTDPRVTDLFWCRLDYLRPLAEKQWLPVDRLGALEV